MSFEPNRELINVKFEGYKLSNQPLIPMKSELPYPLKVALLKEGEFSFQYMRAYTLQNHLHPDPSDPSSVYFWVDDGSVMKSTFQNDSISQQVVFHLPQTKLDHHANMTLSFLTDDVGVLSAGDNCIVIFTKYDSTSSTTSEKWSVLKSFSVSEDNPVLIVAAALGASGVHADILCAELFCNHSPSIPDAAGAVALYKWFRITLKTNPVLRPATPKDIDQDVLLLNSFKSKSLSLYTAFQHQPSTKAMQLLFMSETTPLIGTQKSKKVRVSDIEGDDALFHEEERYHGLGYEREKYQWTQNGTDVILSFELPDDVRKGDISCLMESDKVVVGLTDGTTLLRGDLSHSIDPEASTWTIQENRLEVTLEKEVEGVEWKYLLKDYSSPRTKLPENKRWGDDISPEMLETAQKLLSELSGKDEGGHHQESYPMVQSMLEECDTSNEDATMFVISESGELKQRIGLGGSQLVLTAPSQNRQTHYFSLRYDVDALTWLPQASVTTSQSYWTHVATFNALGYVQASKRDRRFTTCSPNLKFAVISESTRHVFVYLQPKKGLPKAVEHIYTFPNRTDILGVVASDNGIVFVLCSKELTVLKIPDL